MGSSLSPVGPGHYSYEDMDDQSSQILDKTARKKKAWDLGPQLPNFNPELRLLGKRNRECQASGKVR